jgi:hypothetical protein
MDVELIFFIFYCRSSYLWYKHDVQTSACLPLTHGMLCYFPLRKESKIMSHSNSCSQARIRIKDAPPSIHLIDGFIAKCSLSKSWYWKSIDIRTLARRQSWEPVKFLESNMKVVLKILIMNSERFAIMKQFDWAHYVPNMEPVNGSCKYKWYGIAQTEVSQHIRENIIGLDMMQKVWICDTSCTMVKQK